MIFDEQKVRQWYKVLKHNKDLVELRLLKDKSIYSGYFTNTDVIVDELTRFYSDEYQVYFTLNEVSPACYNKIQRDKITRSDATTTDEQITKRTTLLIDFDPVRVTKTSSTNAQLKLAAERALSVEKFLNDYDFPEPIHGLSGNGCHLLYDIDLPNTAEVKIIIKNFLNVISGLFTDGTVDIDKSVFSAGQISKVFGTYARKGANTKEAPHRLSRITKVPAKRENVKLSSLITVSKLLPTKEERTKYFKSELASGTGVDVDGFLKKHNIGVLREEAYQGGRKIVLEHCVYNHSHKAPDAVIFVSGDGIPNYHCSHNSCSDKNGWHHLREFFEPDFYKDRENRKYNNNNNNNKQYQQQQYQGRNDKNKQEKSKPIEENEEIGKMWLNPLDIEYLDTSKLIAIPTGYTALDSRIVGLYLSETTIVTGRNASGKSSWLNQVMLNAVDAGFKVGVWSGELDDHKLMPWISQSAAGPNHVEQDTSKENFYYVDEKIDWQIKRWLSNKLYIYNNKYFFKWSQIEYALQKLVDEGIQLFVLDNLMAMDISDFSGDSNEKQKSLVQAIMAFAKKYKVHCILVAHPRKEVTFLRKESISGSGDISNLVDNIFIIHRVNQDFAKRAPEFLGQNKVDECVDFSNVVEVAKNRSLGVEDFLAGMYFDVKSRRFMNYRYEEKQYGWEDFVPVEEQNLPF